MHVLKEFEDCSEIVKWKEWTKKKAEVVKKLKEDGKTKTVKVEKVRNEFVVKEDKVSELVLEIVKDMETIPKHLHIANQQQSVRANLSKNLPKSVILFDVDYSENVKIKYRDEPQSAHYVKPQITLFPIVAEYWDHPEDTAVTREEFILLSDDLTHSTLQADVFISEVRSVLKERGMKLDEMMEIYFSDRSPTQFSNKDMSWIVSQRPNYHWNFYGARHGKNQSDTAGGNFKTKLARYILETGDLIRSLQEFQELSHKWEQPSKLNSKRMIITIPLEVIEERKNEYSKTPKKLAGIKQYHQMRSERGDGTLQLNTLSCYCQSCFNVSRSECQIQKAVKFTFNSRKLVKRYKL